MNASELRKKIEDANERSLDVELEKYEKKYGESLDVAINNFLIKAYKSYDTVDVFTLSKLSDFVLPSGKWEEIEKTTYEYRSHGMMVGSTRLYQFDEYKKELIDEKKETYKYFKRAKETKTFCIFDDLHEVLKTYVINFLQDKEYFTIRKTEPKICEKYHQQEAYEYLDVYYDESLYNEAMAGINKDVKKMVAEVERLIEAIKVGYEGG